ncbi:MAG TPA: hypothetical protein VJN18_25110 [Polyangiaceae bacterium]|nr:hypothetical protein [Polyangiaceae bacterium]
MLDPIDGAAPVTRAINCWVAIKALGTPTAAEIESELTTKLSSDNLDNLGPISLAYVSSGLGYLLNLGLVTVGGAENRYSIPDPSRLIRRASADVELVLSGATFHKGYMW